MNYLDLYDSYLQQDVVRNQAEHEVLFARAAEAISAPLTVALEDLHGGQLDFSCLTRPLAYLALYQVAPGRQLPAREAAALQKFASYKALASVRPGDPTHALLLEMLRADDPAQLAVSYLKTLPQAAPPPVSPLRRGRVRAGRVGISFGMSFVERLLIQTRLPGRVRFLRDPHVVDIEPDAVLRQELLARVLATIPADEDPVLRAVVLYLVLVMPTFMLEGLKAQAASAIKEAAGLRALVVGTEFQRKPAVAVLIARMKHQGKPVIGIQHGGGYGQTDPNWWERAERFFCDQYRTWGYSYGPGDIPLASIKLSHQASRGRKRATHGVDSRCLLLAIPYISDELECSLFSPPYQFQLAAVEHSLRLLQPALQAGYRLNLRVHPKNAHSGLRSRLGLDHDANVEISSGTRGSIADDALRYRALFFSSPQATGVAECLAAGRDFHVIAEPGDFWIREEAKVLYAEMRETGLWITRPDQVRDLVSADFPSPTEAQREFRRRFAACFALHDKRYLKHWLEMLEHA